MSSNRILSSVALLLCFGLPVLNGTPEPDTTAQIELIEQASASIQVPAYPIFTQDVLIPEEPEAPKSRARQRVRVFKEATPEDQFEAPSYADYLDSLYGRDPNMRQPDGRIIFGEEHMTSTWRLLQIIAEQNANNPPSTDTLTMEVDSNTTPVRTGLIIPDGVFTSAKDENESAYIPSTTEVLKDGKLRIRGQERNDLPELLTSPSSNPSSTDTN
jgi:hypothetical protein